MLTLVLSNQLLENNKFNFDFLYVGVVLLLFNKVITELWSSGYLSYIDMKLLVTTIKYRLLLNHKMTIRFLCKNLP